LPKSNDEPRIYQAFIEKLFAVVGLLTAAMWWLSAIADEILYSCRITGMQLAAGKQAMLK